MAKKNKVQPRSDWDTVKINVMIRVLIYKFEDFELYKKLISIPDNALLVKHTWKDKVWGDGGDRGTEKNGTNYLGKILTTLSHVLKYGNCDKMSKKLWKKIRIRRNKNEKSLK